MCYFSLQSPHYSHIPRNIVSVKCKVNSGTYEFISSIGGKGESSTRLHEGSFYVNFNYPTLLSPTSGSQSVAHHSAFVLFQVKATKDTRVTIKILEEARVYINLALKYWCQQKIGHFFPIVFLHIHCYHSFSTGIFKPGFGIILYNIFL